MNVLDGLILIPVAYGLYSGFKEGLVKEVLGLAGVVAGIGLAFAYYATLAPLLAERLGWSLEVVKWFSGILIFIATIAAAQLLATLIGRLLDLVFLGPLNRALGALFSGLKWTLLVSLAMLAVAAFGLRPGEELRGGSLAYGPVERVAPWVLQGIGLVSPAAAQAMEGIMDKLDDTVDAVLPFLPQEEPAKDAPDETSDDPPASRRPGNDRNSI